MFMYTKALKIMKKVLGPDHRNVAATYHNIAQVYVCRASSSIEEQQQQQDEHQEQQHQGLLLPLQPKQQQDIEKALKIYKDVLKVQRSALGDGHVDIAVTLDSIAHAHELKGKYDRAVKFYNKALRVRRNALGKRHILMAVTLDRIGKFHMERDGNMEEALRRFREALDIYRVHYHSLSGSSSGGEDCNVVVSVTRNIQIVSEIIQRYQRQQQQQQDDQLQMEEAMFLAARDKLGGTTRRTTSSSCSSSNNNNDDVIFKSAINSPGSSPRRRKHRRSHAQQQQQQQHRRSHAQH
mmetsp:Transcript_5566/g.8445  ORF Transcript_5566/g.8445 Transcript_5566/m.8445 type:complete len:294 (+) Transcript_5566:1534-2415(+)